MSDPSGIQGSPYHILLSLLGESKQKPEQQEPDVYGPAMTAELSPEQQDSTPGNKRINPAVRDVVPPETLDSLMRAISASDYQVDTLSWPNQARFFGMQEMIGNRTEVSPSLARALRGPSWEKPKRTPDAEPMVRVLSHEFGHRAQNRAWGFDTSGGVEKHTPFSSVGRSVYMLPGYEDRHKNDKEAFADLFRVAWNKVSGRDEQEDVALFKPGAITLMTQWIERNLQPTGQDDE